MPGERGASGQNRKRSDPFPARRSVVDDWHWFRYPYLHEGDTLEKRHAVIKYLQEYNYKVAEVTLDFEDYASDS